MNNHRLPLRLCGLVMLLLTSFVPNTWASTTSAPADQCSEPVAERVGAWMCTQPQPTAGGVHLLGAHDDYWCRAIGIVPGCWTVNLDNRAYANFHTSKVDYGWGKTIIGNVNLAMNWTLSGPSIKMHPIQVRNTKPTISTTFKGYIMNGAKNVLGSTKNRCKDGNFGATSAGTLRTWTPSGCTAYDNQSWDHESVVEVQWRVVGYPGYFFIYIKSPVAHTDDREIYLFTDNEDLPAIPWGAGHAG